MSRALWLIVVPLLVAADAPGVALQNHEESEKQVRHLKCVGVGVTCSSSSTFGVIFVDAGAGVGTATPIYMDAGAIISCANAAENQAGCIRGVSGQVQKLSGYLQMMGETTFSGPESYGTGLTAALDSDGIAVSSNGIFSNGNGLGITIEGRRNDTNGSVRIRTNHFVDGGIIAQVDQPRPCQNSAGIMSWSPEGTHYGNVVDGPACNNSADTSIGGLWHDSSVAGAVSLRRGAQDSITIWGNLQGLNYALLEDGGHPNAANYSTGAVHTLSDGGTAFEWAGFHGATQLGTSGYQPRGLLVTFDNTQHPVYDHRAFIDFNGGYGQSNQLSKSQWPTGPPLNVVTTLGQFYPNVLESTMYYDFDSSSDDGHKWYWRHSFIDGGAEYTQFAHQAPVFAPAILVNAQLVAAATLGGWVVPGSEIVQLDALHLYIGTAGSGGSSNAVIRFEAGGNQCDFAFACNSVAGPYRLVGTGNGCTPVRNSTYTVTVNSLGACTGAGAPVLTGNITPEVRWR